MENQENKEKLGRRRRRGAEAQVGNQSARGGAAEAQRSRGAEGRRRSEAQRSRGAEVQAGNQRFWGGEGAKEQRRESDGPGGGGEGAEERHSYRPCLTPFL